MVVLSPPYRRATPDDALALAELVNVACGGMPEYCWAQIAQPDVSVWDIGQQCVRRDSGEFSYRNAVLREEKGSVASALIGYPLARQPEAVNVDEIPAMFIPLRELEGLAPNTWYVNALATYSRYRGQGHGTGLLAIAEQLARDTQTVGMSLIVSDANEGAMRLYERQGYHATASRPMIKEHWQNPGRRWILLRKSF